MGDETASEPTPGEKKAEAKQRKPVARPKGKAESAKKPAKAPKSVKVEAAPAADKSAPAKKKTGKQPKAPKADAKAKAEAEAPKKEKPIAKPKGVGDAAKPRPVPKVRKRALVVVESPAKAKTIKKYLGVGYTVKASVGHVKDLPKSKLSVDIEHGSFQPNYEIIRGKSKVLQEIKDAAKDVDTIYLAPDPDREGEAIAWHIAEELGKKLQPRTFRVSFNEITKRAVQEAIQNPRPLDQNRFEAQQARRVLDRIVGYQISPILWDKVRRGLSAGRVQSVAVRLIVEREREISAFKAEEYWSVECLLEAGSPPPFVAKVIKDGNDKFRPSGGDAARAAVEILKNATYKVETITRRERRRKPLAPLITSKLQQEGANRLRFTAKRTMMIAQQLYEGVELGDEGSVALITYMRTDSTRVSNDALVAVREHINKQYGPDYLPPEPNVYKSKKSAQDAHEAIRPTSLEYPPERVQPFLSSEQFKLYSLIWRWFVASQMTQAVFDQTTVDIKADRFTLRATGSIMKFPGFLAAHGVGEDVEEEKPKDEAADSSEDDSGARAGLLPELKEQEALSLKKLDPTQHFTQPPPRFAESSLVKELEDKGIGRPSTYATILSTIVTRGYVEKRDDQRFHPSELGVLTTDLLVTSFPQELDVGFTAAMEEQLDEVEEGKVDWVKLLGDFYNGGFKDRLEKAKIHMRDVKREEIPTEHVCEKCGQAMVIKWGRNGSFLACKGYPQCRNTRDYVRKADGSIELVPEQTTDEKCPTCTGPMVVKRGRFGMFFACQKYPECKGTRPMSIGVTCPNECGGYVAERRSKRGRIFYGCSSYPNCTFAAWDRPVPGPCPQCKHKFLIRKYSKKDGVLIKCPNKECGYTRDPEMSDEDVKAVAAAE